MDSEILKTISWIIKKPTERLLAKLEKEFTQIIKNKILEYKIQEYKSCRFVKTLLFRHEPIDIYKFYKPQNIYKYGESLTVDNIEKLFNSPELKSNCITIIGKAGSGKSTMSKYILLKSYEEDFKIPIRIELRELNETKLDLFQFIYENKIKFNEIAFNKEKISNILNDGEFIFIFDGFDEIKDAKKTEILKEIEIFSKKFSKNYFILTTRPNSLAETLNNFDNFNISELSYSNIVEFINNCFDKQEEKLKNELIVAINDEKNKYLKDLITNPLLLSMLVLTFRTSNLPKLKSEFYYNVFDALYQLHGTISKQGYKIEIRSGLDKNQIMNVLKEFSVHTYFQEQYTFTRREVESKLRETKNSIKTDFDINYFIEDTINSIGIWHRDGLEITFIHRSIQEYFSALAISSYNEKLKLNIFNSFKNKIKEKLDYVLTKDNFFLLLKDVDDEFVVKHLFLPLFNESTKKLKMEENEVFYYNYFGNLTIIINFFYIKGYSKTLDSFWDFDFELTYSQLINLQSSIDIPRWDKNVNLQILNSMKKMILNSEKINSEIINLLNRTKKGKNKIIDIINIS